MSTAPQSFNTAAQLPHCHDYAEIIIPQNKAVQLRCQDSVLTVSVQELCIVPPNIQHQLLGGGQSLVITLPNVLLNKSAYQFLGSGRVFPIHSDVAALIALIKQEQKTNPNSGSIRYLYYYLYNKVLGDYGSPSIRYLHTHYEETINVAKLAELENYNPTYFNEWFKKQTGYTPAQYLRFLRINAAKDLLDHTSQSIVDIALQVGYTSHSSFTRAFRDVEGISPQEYREQNIPIPKHSRHQEGG